jgi:hypothetical protein
LVEPKEVLLLESDGGEVVGLVELTIRRQVPGCVGPRAGLHGIRFRSRGAHDRRSALLKGVVNGETLGEAALDGLLHGALEHL